MNKIQRLAVLKKHAKNFVVGPKANRPIYTAIHYGKDGLAVVTNTYCLLRVENVHNFQEPVNLHHKTDEVVEGTYLDTERLFPSRHTASIEVSYSDLEAWVQYHRVAGMLGKDNPIMVRMAVENAKTVAICQTNTTEYKGKLPGVVTGADFKICYDPVYMKNILEAIADFKPLTVEIKFSGVLSPIVVKTDVGVSALLLPIRGNE